MMDEQGQELPVVELQLHGGDPLQLAAELTMANKRVAELEAENERLRAALMPLETSSIASAVQEAAAATMQRDQLQAVLEQERRAVEALAEQCASQKPQRMPWMGCPVPAPDGYPGCLLGGRRPDCARCWAEWARKRAREDGGDIARVSDRWAREWVHGVFEGRWAALGLLAKRAREREREEAVKGDEPDGERNA